MKKIIKLTVLSVVCALLLASCSTFNEGAIGTFPMRDIPVRSIEDLQSGSFEILGTVTGTGNVDGKDPEDGDSLGYGSLEVLDVDRMYFGIDKMPDLEDPYAVSLANAIHAMIKNAREMEASFVTFPSYTIEVVDGRVVTTVSAVAVKIVDPSQVVVINRSQVPENVTYVVSAATN